MRRAAAAHGEHEKRTGEADPNWPDWYAQYMVAEQAGDGASDVRRAQRADSMLATAVAGGPPSQTLPPAPRRSSAVTIASLPREPPGA